jgi:glycosyltransferase involved in cell wall biosynthesis
MKIAIDGNEANIKNRVGVNQYGFELLWAIYKLQEEWKDRHNIIVYLKKKPQKDLPKETPFFRYKILPGKGAWILTKLMPHLFFAEEKPDVLFTPSHYLPPLSPVPRICSIMDLGYLEFSGQLKTYDFWQLKYWSAISIFVSKRVLAISNSTKEDIVRHYPFALKKVRVTHLAYDPEKFNTKINDKLVRRVKKKYSIVGDYVLFLSTLKPSKNVEGLLKAWRIIKDDFPNTKLVIAGKKGWLYESIFEKVKKLNLTHSVIFTGFVSKEDKPLLIKGAKVFVLPSFWEGFGLDSLNAMACGVPVVVSAAGSLPEVVGDAGLYVDPYNPKDISSKLKKVLSAGKIEYNKMIKKGIKQAQKFSWEKTARKTMKVIEEAVK